MNRRTFITSGVALITAGLLPCHPGRRFLNPFGDFQSVAIRGKSHELDDDLPGNSMQSLRASVFNGVTAVEIDILATADGVPVLGHSSQITLSRYTTCAGKLTETGLVDLMKCVRVDIGDGVQHKVPLLAEALKLPLKRFYLDLKLTGEQYKYPTQQYIEAVASTVEATGRKRDCYLMSYDHAAARWLVDHGFHCGFKAYLKKDDSLDDMIDSVYDTGSTMICVNQVHATPSSVAAARRRGIWLLVWAHGSHDNLKKLLLSNCRKGVEGIISRRPLQMARLWSGLQHSIYGLPST